MIAEWTPKFDKAGVARLVAAKAPKATTAKSVIVGWEEKGRIAAEKGTVVHSYISDRLDNELVVNYAHPIAVDKHFSEMRGWDDWWKKSKKYLEPLFIEQVVGDKELRLAGTVDAIFRNLMTGHLDIYDWKTGKFNFENSWETLLPPFSDLENCHLNRYSLQLSLYRLLIVRWLQSEVGECYIVHLQDNGQWKKYKALDFTERLGKLLRS